MSLSTPMYRWMIYVGAFFVISNAFNIEYDTLKVAFYLNNISFIIHWALQKKFYTEKTVRFFFMYLRYDIINTSA